MDNLRLCGSRDTTHTDVDRVTTGGQRGTEDIRRVFTMTHDRTNPPPDEIMGKVVAKWKGWDDIHLLNDEDCDGNYWDVDRVYGPYSCPLFHQYKKDAAHDLTGFVFDPRTDTNAALELLHWLVNRTQGIGFWWKPKSWVFDLPTGNIDVPISGQPMRTAVCWLAAEVLGVSNE